jgi:myxalamid-type polyketide synthase MxaE and MxaD
MLERQAPATPAHGHDGAESPSLRDIAFTAGAGRAHHGHRLAVVADGLESLRAALAGLEDTVSGNRRLLDPERDGLVFVIPGQGAQWTGMGRGLLAEEASFRAALAACEQAFLPYTEDWTLTEILHARDTDPRRQ